MVSGFFLLRHRHAHRYLCGLHSAGRVEGHQAPHVLAKVTGAKQLTLPDELLTSFPGVDCFNVTEEGGRIVLTPVRIRRVDAVRQKLAELDITDEDVRDAVGWARRRD